MLNNQEDEESLSSGGDEQGESGLNGLDQIISSSLTGPEEAQEEILPLGAEVVTDEIEPDAVPVPDKIYNAVQIPSQKLATPTVAQGEQEDLVPDGVKKTAPQDAIPDYSTSLDKPALDISQNFVVVVDDFKEDFNAQIIANSHYNGAGFPKFPLKGEEVEDVPREKLDELFAEEQMRRRIQAMNKFAGTRSEADLENQDSESDLLMERPKFQYLRKPHHRALDASFEIMTSPPPLNDELNDNEEEFDNENYEEADEESAEEQLKHKGPVLFLIFLSVIALIGVLTMAFVRARRRRSHLNASYLPLHQ